MFTFYINKDSKTPIYIQLYQFIKEEIENGNLIANQKLPSKRKLSEHLKISQITVDASYQQLVLEGYIRSVPKSGFYVEEFKKPIFNVNSSVIGKIYNEEKKENYLYDLKTNVVDTKLFPYTTWASLAREVLCENSYEVLNVTHSQGQKVLREEIAKYLYNFRGIKADANQIIVGAGSESLIDLIIKLLGRDKIYAIENPGYSKIYHIFKNNDVSIHPIDLDQQGLKVEELRQSRANIVHVTPSHQFPSGVVMPLKRRQELLEWASEDNDRYILEDDYDSEFRFSGQPIPALQGLDYSEKVIYFNSFSKSIAPSLRISYLVLPLRLLEIYHQRFSYYTCSVPNFDQFTLYKFLKGGYFERHINRMRKAYKGKIDYFLEVINKSRLAKVVNIHGHDAGLHFLMEINNKMDEKELTQKAKSVGIRVYGFSEYYHFKSLNKPLNKIVIGYSSLTKDDIKKVIKKLEEVWVYL